MSLFRQLQHKQEAGTPIRIGLIGAGKFGSMFLSQADRLPGVHVVAIADLSPNIARKNLELVGWDAAQYDARSMDDALRTSTTCVTDDTSAVIAHPQIDMIVECTGNPIVAVDHLLMTFDHAKHAISATVEADAVCGSALAQRAAQANVIYSMAYGDQPAMVCELVDWARTCGFSVAAAGRGHKWMPEYRKSTPDTIWDYWGLSAQQAARGRLNPKMFNSFLDGTKPAIESAAIANATGLQVPGEGLAYPAGSVDDIPNLMRPKAVGGTLENSGMVEVISSLTEDGTEIPYNIRNGVWVCLEADTPYQKNCFEEYKVVTDDTGRYFSLYKRWHLIGLELGMSVASVALRGESTGTAARFHGDVVAVAKRDLAAGEILDGEGGYCVAGQLRPTTVSVPMKALPLGLTDGATLKRQVKADQILTYHDVDLDESTHAFKLRRELENTH